VYLWQLSSEELHLGALLNLEAGSDLIVTFLSHNNLFLRSTLYREETEQQKRCPKLLFVGACWPSGPHFAMSSPVSGAARLDKQMGDQRAQVELPTTDS
jgi:hypothetical protein